MINNKLPAIFYGGDYNPDQWPEEVWREDMRLFKLAGLNIVTLPVFSWAKLQPAEDRYCFDWLDKIFDLVTANGLFVCLATSTAAQPAWLSRKYPEILPVDSDGRKRTHGGRGNYCPNSPVYRRLATELARKLAEHYRNHPALLLWHIGNEYGPYCYCETCAREFRRWLKERYGTIEELNRRWNMSFWGHTVYDWAEIVPPSARNGDNRCFQGMMIDYKRFMSDANLACYQSEYQAVKAVTPDIPATTNFWGLFNNLDLQKWAESMDVVAWDSYPALDEPMAHVAMRHDYMRGLKQGQPFLLMEQTPSQQNWQPYNSLKRPGVMRLWSYQAIARGADAVLFFQLRRSYGACEKYHGALIGHAGHEKTRVFRECAELGRELQALGDTLLDARVRSKAALLFDIDTWNAVELTSGPSVDLKYLTQAQKYYRAFYDQNIAVDVIPPDAALSGYELIVAPVLYMLKPGVARNLEEFVRAGGIFVTTFFSGLVNESDLATLGGYPGELRNLLGIWVEEIDALLPEMKNRIILSEPLGRLQGEYECGLLCDLINPEGARTLAVYGRDFYAGRPVLTENQFGRGKAYYVASDPEPGFLEGFIQYLCDMKKIQAPLEAARGIEVTRRYKGSREFTFVLNHHNAEMKVDLKGVSYRELLTGQKIQEVLPLKPKGVAILERFSAGD